MSKETDCIITATYEPDMAAMVKALQIILEYGASLEETDDSKTA